MYVGLIWSTPLFQAIDVIWGLRLSREEEEVGADLLEHGVTHGHGAMVKVSPTTRKICMQDEHEAGRVKLYISSRPVVRDYTFIG